MSFVVMVQVYADKGDKTLASTPIIGVKLNEVPASKNMFKYQYGGRGDKVIAGAYVDKLLKANGKVAKK